MLPLKCGGKMPRYKKIDNMEFVSRMKEEFLLQKNTKDLAEVLDISKKTCQRYLIDLDLHYPKGRPKGKISQNKLTGGLAKWIKKHPGESLSSNVQEIMEETNLTKDQVKSFLYRLKKKHQKRIKNLGDLRDYKGGLKGSKGSIVLFSDIKEYSLKHSPYGEEITISALLKNKKRIAFKTTLSRLAAYERLH